MSNREESEKNYKEGVVIENLPNTTFKVRLDGENRDILAHLSGKMRVNFIRIIVGDRVKVEMGDESRGRIVYRYK